MNGKIDVEIKDGKVVAVWNNCTLLPFQQHDIDDERYALLGDANPDGIVFDVNVEYSWTPAPLNPDTPVGVFEWFGPQDDLGKSA